MSYLARIVTTTCFTNFLSLTFLFNCHFTEQTVWCNSCWRDISTTTHLTDITSFYFLVFFAISQCLFFSGARWYTSEATKIWWSGYYQFLIAQICRAAFFLVINNWRKISFGQKVFGIQHWSTYSALMQKRPQ